MFIKVIHLYGLGEEFVPIFISAFPDRKIRTLKSKAELFDSIGDIEVLFVFKPPRGVWSGAKRLRLIQIAGAGVDTLLPAPDLHPRVSITNAKGIHVHYMSEYALTMMLSFAKNLTTTLANQRSRTWQRIYPTSLAGKTCCILGMGTIGRGVAERAKQFGMRVIGVQREPKEFRAADEVLPSGEICQAVCSADYIVVVLPLTPQTRNLLDAAFLSNLKQEAVLINMARGGILDEVTLAKMLIAGRLRGAALDVFDEEPLPDSSELWTIPNLIITPHVAGALPDYWKSFIHIFTENVSRLENEKPLRNEVDRSLGY